MSVLLIPYLLALVVEASPSLLKLDLEPPRPSPAGEVELILVDPIGESEVLRRQVPVPWHGELKLDRGFANLRLEIASEAFWASPRSLAVLPMGESLRVELFQRGEIIFTEVPADGAEAKAAPIPIRVEITSAPTAPGKVQLAKTSLDCRREREHYFCPAPAVALDLRLEKQGHVPRYFFGVKAEPGKKLDLGKIRFERGASISGFVTVEEGEPNGAEIRVEGSGAFSPLEGQRRELRRLAAKANERGFFQVMGVAPGGYRLEASRRGLSPTELWPVDVLEGQETALAEPVHLAPAAELELRVSPATGPLGRPWKLILIRERPGLADGTETFEGETDPEGKWIREALHPGSYLLHVANPDGEKTGAGDDSIWASSFLDLVSGRQTHFVDVPAITVEGTFLAGDDPVVGRLIFGGFHGAPHVTLRSDEEGHFAGQLPRAGQWDLDAEIGGQLRTLSPVEVEPRGGRPARLEIQLPDTRFHGKVTHRGKAVSGASLWGRGLEKGKSARFDVDTDGEGSFDLKGLVPGAYSVTTSSAALRLVAPPMTVEIQESVESPPVEIKLEELIRIEGQILANSVPAPNASVGLLLRATESEESWPGQGDAAGTVQLQVPESTREVGLVIAAPGFAWQILALRPSIDGKGFAPFVTEVGQNGGTLRLAGRNLGQGRLFSAGIGVPLHLVKDTLRSAGYLAESEDSWILANAAPGNYRICIADHCAEGILPPGGVLDLEFAVP